MIQLQEKSIHPDYYKYPFNDGEPMAETTLHQRWIVKIKENIDAATEGQDVFVASDLLWYPVEGQVRICKAPDVMVAVGRPKGDRYSYLQWHEENVAPQVVIEIHSKSNRRGKNKLNTLAFYEKYGVEEFYTYDPEKNLFVVYQRQGDKLTRLEGLQQWVSPLLKVRFEWFGETFKLYRPDGSRFVHFSELERQTRYLSMEVDAVNALLLQEKKWTMEMEKRAEKEKERAEKEKERAEKEKERAEDAEKRSKILAEKLKALGIDPDNV
ncbi:MAG TPA: Uma2 family endonuclease [Bacteroidetes bacterium]|nr:Uma2 family endonuclease [Bacteroidota bacterium]